MNETTDTILWSAVALVSLLGFALWYTTPLSTIPGGMP